MREGYNPWIDIAVLATCWTFAAVVIYGTKLLNRKRDRD